MKKRLLQLVALCLILTAFVSVLTACGASTLEEAVSKDKSVQKELDRVGKKNNMDINIKDNLVTYVYHYGSDVSEDSKSLYTSSFESAFTQEKSTFVNLIKKLEDKTDISGIKMKIVVKDKSDDTLYNITYDNKGIVK